MENIRINYKKLRQTRKSKDLSIMEVSEKTGFLLLLFKSMNQEL